MEENADYVEFTGSEISSWFFFVSGTARTVPEECKEIMGIVKKVLEITHGFYLPTKIVYGINVYPPDASLFDILMNGTRSTISREIQSETGLSIDQLADDIRNVALEDMAKYVRGVFFTDGRTLFTLRETDVYVDKYSKGLYESYIDDSIILPNPEFDDDPLIIEILHSTSKGGDELVARTDTAYYQLRFRTRTSMWFAKTESGAINRQRLKSVLNQVYNRFNVVYAVFLSDYYSDAVLGLKS